MCFHKICNREELSGGHVNVHVPRTEISIKSTNLFIDLNDSYSQVEKLGRQALLKIPVV